MRGRTEPLRSGAGAIGPGAGRGRTGGSLPPEDGAALAAVEQRREALLAYVERRDGAGQIRERAVDALAGVLDAAIPVLARLQRRVADLQRREI